MLRWRFFQIRLVSRPNVEEALPSLMESSWSTVVFFVIVDPRYVNLSTFSSVVSSIVKVEVSLDCDIVTVFFRLIVRPNLSHDLEK